MELQEQLSQALSKSVQEVFATMFSIDLQEKNSDGDDSTCDVVCSIGFTGNVEGSIFIRLSKDSACNIVSKMLETNFSEVNSDVTDGCGELTNLIVGSTKMKMNSDTFRFDISIPTVFLGQNLQMSSSDADATISKEFSCNGIAFSTQFVYKVPKDKPAMGGAEAPKSDASARLNELLSKKA